MEVLTLNKTEISPGEDESFSLFVGMLPSGTRISIKTHVFRSQNPGPTVLLLAGLHGDEVNGVESLRRLLSSGTLAKLLKGTVIVIPILNVYGFIDFSRQVSDGKDVNRSFPGSSSGSLAARIAYLLSHNVLPEIDFGIDLHTGAANRFNYPQVRYTTGDSAAHELAGQFGAPFTIAKSAIAKSLRKTALGMQIPILVYEGGEALRLNGKSIDSAIDGIKNVLRAQGMIKGKFRNRATIQIDKTSWVRAKKAGIFVRAQASGAQVQKGDVLGTIYDPHAKNENIVHSTKEGFIIGHNNQPVVNQGDPLFHIGYTLNT